MRIGAPDYPETSRISANTLALWVDDLAWSLNGMTALGILLATTSYFCSEIHAER